MFSSVQIVSRRLSRFSAPFRKNGANARCKSAERERNRIALAVAIMFMIVPYVLCIGSFCLKPKKIQSMRVLLANLFEGAW